METSPPRTLLTVGLALWFLACGAFLLHHVGAGPPPDGLASWCEENEWLVWTAVAPIPANAAVLPALRRLAAASGDRR